MKSNLHSAIAQIELAPIPDTIKRKAIIEICHMASDRKYARKVQFLYRADNAYNGIDAMFLWDKTDAGFLFWNKLFTIINK